MVSSDMDTVTEADMAIGMALNGGLGLVHYNMSQRQQVKEVTRVKHHVHGLIQDPICFTADKLIGDVLITIEEKNFQFRTFPIVDEAGRLLGLLPGRVVKERYRDRKVTEGMLSREKFLRFENRKLEMTQLLRQISFSVSIWGFISYW